MQEITSLGHVAIRVRDVETTLDFYVNKLGFSEMMRLDRDGRLFLVYLRITDDQYLEVFPEGDRAPGKQANGLNHFCLTVSDIDAVETRLGELGIPLTSEKKKVEDGNWQLWVEDPDGNRIEFMQMDPDCLQLKAIARLRQSA